MPLQTTWRDIRNLILTALGIVAIFFVWGALAGAVTGYIRGMIGIFIALLIAKYTILPLYARIVEHGLRGGSPAKSTFERLAEDPEHVTKPD